jgi:hypothetical protein
LCSIFGATWYDIENNPTKSYGRMFNISRFLIEGRSDLFLSSIHLAEVSKEMRATPLPLSTALTPLAPSTLNGILRSGKLGRCLDSDYAEGFSEAKWTVRVGKDEAGVSVWDWIITPLLERRKRICSQQQGRSEKIMKR